MKTPTLEEVKKMYSNVKEVRCLFDKEIYNISEWERYFNNGNKSYWVEISRIDQPQAKLYDFETNKFAEIISYKSNPNIDLSKLTTELITELCKDEKIREVMINNGVVKNELEVNRWYKSKTHKEMLIYPTIKDQSTNALYGYGFSTDGFFEYYDKDTSNYCLCNDVASEYLYLATPQEIETALKNEAVKRGFADGVKYESPHFKIQNTCKGRFRFDVENNALYNNGTSVFIDGEWSEIIKEEPKKQETYIKIPLSVITLTDSDKKLGKKVRDIAKNV